MGSSGAIKMASLIPMKPHSLQTASPQVKYSAFTV
jgi:hypothetical protein